MLGEGCPSGPKGKPLKGPLPQEAVKELRKAEKAERKAEYDKGQAGRRGEARSLPVPRK